jgi:hypothetical protein
MGLKVAVAKVRKAVVAAVTVAVLGAVKKWVDVDMDAAMVVVDALFVAVLVWAVPNAKDVLSDA